MTMPVPACRMVQGTKGRWRATGALTAGQTLSVLLHKVCCMLICTYLYTHTHTHTHTHAHTQRWNEIQRRRVLRLTSNCSTVVDCAPSFGSLYTCSFSHTLLRVRRHERRLYGAHHSPHAAVGRERQQDARLWQLQPWLAARPRHVRLRLRASRAISVYLAGAPERVWLLHLPARVSANGRSLAWRVGRLRPSVL